jgi:hypothetical protein
MQVANEGVHLFNIGLDLLDFLKKIVYFPLVDWNSLDIKSELN